MALKGHRRTVAQDISFFMDEVAERGGPVLFSTAGSGAALDDSSALVTYPSHLVNPAGTSVRICPGVLMNDMVNLDQTRQHINFHKDEVQKGGKVTLLQEGEILTDRIDANVTPALNDIAYCSSSGFFTNSATPENGPIVGHFMSTKDEDGYAKIYVKVPNR